MAFWSTEKLVERTSQEGLVEPFDRGRVKHGAYELAVGAEAFITSVATGTKQALGAADQVIIPPGQFGLLLTEEVVAVPGDAIGFISIRASIKFHGLVNVSGFHVDPGFKGRLKFAVFNAGSRNIVVSRGEPIFMLWFSDLDRQTADGYGGLRSGQNEITSQDLMRLQGEIASPGQLKKDIEDIRHSLNNLKYGLGIVVALLAAAIGGIYFRPSPPPIIVHTQTVPSQPAPQATTEQLPQPRPQATPSTPRSSPQVPTHRPPSEGASGQEQGKTRTR